MRSNGKIRKAGGCKSAAKASNEANVKAIKYMITAFNASKEQILGKYSEEEYYLALKELE